MKSFKNLWVGNFCDDTESLIIESQNIVDKNVDYEEFLIGVQQLEQIVNGITLYLKSFEPSNVGENVEEMSKVELLQQVEYRNDYNLAREKARWADYKERCDSPDTQERRLQLDPGLVVTAQKQKIDKTIYWEAGLELNVLAGFVKFFATGDTEEEARTALNIKVENFISAICVPSKNESEPPPTASAPISPTPVPPAPVPIGRQSLQNT